MKIPDNSLDDLEAKRIVELWKETARQISMEHGVYVEAKFECTTVWPIPSRIYFKLGTYEFESLSDLKRALNNKAFL